MIHVGWPLWLLITVQLLALLGGTLVAGVACGVIAWCLEETWHAWRGHPDPTACIRRGASADTRADTLRPMSSERSQ